jgi:LuxR family transcriptional activator of conjugal transfer of Ti plasmids
MVLRRFTKKSGFDHFALVKMRANEVQVVSDYPVSWQNRYASCDYVSIDPIITTAKRSMRPFNWSAREMTKRGGAIGRFANEAIEFGICSGFTVPMRVGFGAMALLSLASGNLDAEPVTIGDLALAITATAFACLNLTKLAGKASRLGEIGLSPREATCLKWASMGKTKAETATLVGLSEKTVRFYLDRAMSKLGARNVTNAVALAVERDLI